MDIAFLIVPANENNVVIRGMVGDSQDYLFGIDEVLNPVSFSGSSTFQSRLLTGDAPEPSSVGIGAMMFGVLLKRRRR